MRCESRDFFRMAGWGRKVETRWLADAARKAYTKPLDPNIAARALTADRFGVRPQ
jgi:hypothetical protein